MQERYPEGENECTSKQFLMRNLLGVPVYNWIYVLEVEDMKANFDLHIIFLLSTFLQKVNGAFIGGKYFRTNKYRLH